MRALKEVLVVPKPKTNRIWVAWKDGSWCEFDVAGKQLNAYPPLKDSQELVDWAVCVAKLENPGQ